MCYDSHHSISLSQTLEGVHDHATRRLGARLADGRNADDLGTAFGLSADSVAPTVDEWYQDLRNNMQREMTFDVLPERLTQGT